MKLKLKLKNIFMISALAVAGLLGTTSAINSHSSKPKKANAEGERTITISIDNSCGWNISGSNWSTTQICFYNDDVALAIYKLNKENSGYDHPNRIGSPITLSPGAKDAHNNRFASVTVPSNAVCFIVFGSWHNNRSYPQYIPSLESGYDTFMINTNTTTWLKNNRWQNGYWYKSSSDFVQNIYFDRKNTAYTNTSLVCDFYGPGYVIDDPDPSDDSKCTMVNEDIIISSEDIPFSSTCYGGVEYSDVMNVNGATSIDITYYSGGKWNSVLGDDLCDLPIANNPRIFTLSNLTWSEDVPARINVVSDFRKTERWYVNGSIDYTIMYVHFKDSGGTEISTFALDTYVLDGVTYGIAEVPFGAESLWYKYGTGTVGYDGVTSDSSDLSPIDGHDYAFLRTSTNNSATKQSLSPSIPDGYYICGLTGGWNLSDCIRLDETTTGYYTAESVDVSSEASFKIVQVQLNGSKDPNISMWYGWNSGDSSIPSRYWASGTGQGSNITVNRTANYKITVSNFIQEYGKDRCNIKIEPNIALTLKVKIGDVFEPVATFTRDDEGIDPSTVASQYKVEDYTGIKDAAIAIYDGEDLITVVADGDAHNNIYSDEGVLKFKNACSTTIYLKFYYNSSNVLYQKGWSINTYGVKSGTSFYVYDPDGRWNTYDPQIFVRFTDPVNDSYDKCYIVACGSYDSTHKLWSCTVPYIDGGSTPTTWTVATAYRYKSGATTDGYNITGEYWNKVENAGVFTGNQYNSIKVTSIDGGCYHLYADGGIASGRGIYLNWSARTQWGTHTTKFAIYFYGTLENPGAVAWTAFMNSVPGESNIYEATVPQYEGNDVEWIYAIAVACPSDAESPRFTEGEQEYQTQTFYYSKALSVNQYIILNGSLNYDLSAHADLTLGYTDDSRANTWGQRFLDPSIGPVCNNGVTAPDTKRWSALAAEYNQMAPAAKEIVTNAIANTSGCYYEQAVARYDYISAKYNTKTTVIYSDYAHREAAEKFSLSKINPLNPLEYLTNNENQTSTILIIVASSLSLISITALSIILIKKRKRAN